MARNKLNNEEELKELDELRDYYIERKVFHMIASQVSELSWKFLGRRNL